MRSLRLAMDYGFTGWEDLREMVVSLKGEPDFETDARPGAFLLDVEVSGKKGTNRFGYAYYQSLRVAGAACDYDTIMGDSGLAFILQADSVHTAWGKPVDQLDIGWWPLDGFGAEMRLDFLGRASGSEFRSLPCDEYRADPKAAFYRGFHGPIVEALQAGRCPVAVEGDIWVVTGYDDGEPPLIGQTSCQEGTHRARVKTWPWGVVIPGEATAAMDRGQADREALEFAVELMRDELGKRIPPNKLSGCKAFELWARLLRDDAALGAHFYHGNVVWRSPGEPGQHRAVSAGDGRTAWRWRGKVSGGGGRHLRGGDPGGGPDEPRQGGDGRTAGPRGAGRPGGSSCRAGAAGGVGVGTGSGFNERLSDWQFHPQADDAWGWHRKLGPREKHAPGQRGRATRQTQGDPYEQARVSGVSGGRGCGRGRGWVSAGI